MGFRRDVLPVKSVFVTHRHPDHIAFLGALILRMKRNKRTTPLNIICPPNAYQRIFSFIRFFNRQKPPDFVNIKVFTPGAPRKIDIFSASQTEVWAAASCHTTLTAAYAFQQGRTKIVIATDTAPNCPSLLALAQDATAFFHDCTFPVRRFTFARRKGHSNPEGAGNDAHRVGAKNLILVHLSGPRTMNKRALIAGAKRHFEGEVFVANDNSKFTF
jgi:ribonuclease BN (tRNA processing enzyme)